MQKAQQLLGFFVGAKNGVYVLKSSFLVESNVW